MKSIKDIYRRVTKRITPSEMIALELAEAELRLLEAETAVEYAQSVVTYNQTRIKRLKKTLNSLSQED